MVWEGLKRFLGLKGENAGRQEVFAALGVYNFRDEKLDERTGRMQEFHDIVEDIYNLRKSGDGKTPYQLLDELIAKFTEAEQLIDEVAAPYLRSLSNGDAAQLLRAWAQIHAYTVEVAATLRDWFERVEKAKEKGEPVDKPTLPQIVLTNALLGFIIREVTSRMQALVKISWYDKDVSPAYIGTVQSIPPQGERAPTTISGGGEYARRIDFGSSKVQDWKKKTYNRDRGEFVDEGES